MLLSILSAFRYREIESSQRPSILCADNTRVGYAHLLQGPAVPLFWASNTMRSCLCYLRLRASLTMPLMTGKTNVRPVDGPAVTDRDEH